MTATTSRLLIVGGGKMGEAILAGLLHDGAWDKDAITVANPGLEKRQRLQERYGVACVADAAQAPKSQVILLCVKPQVLPAVVAEACEQGVFDEAQLVISIAAGISTEKLAGMLPASTPIVRVMPNLALSVGQGCSALSAGAFADEEAIKVAEGIFAASGTVVTVPEELQAVSTAVSGSGPAYFAQMVDALARSGAARGLEPDQAYEMALQTLVGTAEILRTKEQTAAELVKAVSSPGGTTVAALNAFAERGFDEAIDHGVAAAAARAEELCG